MRLAAFVVASAVCVHAALWATLRQQSNAPDVNQPLASVSYSPFHGNGHPDSGTKPTTAQIRADLKALAPFTRAVRTYSSTGGVELVPGIANEFGLKVSVGAWIDKDQKRNEREIHAALDLAKKHRNVEALVVGNETIYRDELKVDQLIKIIQRVKRETNLPVTTGEIWSVWIEHPDLVSAVDFIAAHILPYWEGIPDSAAVDHAIEIYDKLRQAYPGKRIVIAEFGWPSAGYNRLGADPGRIAQAQVLRDFVSRAEKFGIDYNIIEAFDQPWKTLEGSVGPYWGLFDADTQPKFGWSGALSNPNDWKIATIAVLLGFLLSLPILRLQTNSTSEAALLAVAAHAVGAWFAAIFAYWYGHYFVFGAAFALGLGVTLLIPLMLIALSRVEEIASIAFGARGRSLLAPAPAVSTYLPKVSIHVPAYREPPEMLKATLDAVAALEYPNFECVVVVNNTPEPEYWQPIEAHCRALGARFKFLNAEKLAGFKAGALRLALSHTDPDAEVIGILDADYAVSPDWLKDLVPAFADPTVGLVQAPQDHRDGNRSPLHMALNGEYAGFFDIGMVERNEANAIIVHGTMCLIRRAAMAAAGGWSSDTIVEDTDLGLTILEQGWRALYTNRRYGRGLLPDTFEAFKKQRHRWAYGGVQIVRKHWRRFLPGASLLTRDQKREFTLGWLNWLGAESIGVLVALLNLAWVPVVAFVGIAVPDKILTVPIIASFLISLIHFVALYRLRVTLPVRDMIAALFAAMSVQMTVARAVSDGVIKDRLPFARTAKGGGGKRADFPAFWESVIGGLLLLGAAILVAFNFYQVREINLFALVLVVQSLPFLAATGFALLEASRANDWAFWQRLGAAIGRATVSAAGTPADKHAKPVP